MYIQVMNLKFLALRHSHYIYIYTHHTHTTTLSSLFSYSSFFFPVLPFFFSSLHSLQCAVSSQQIFILVNYYCIVSILFVFLDLYIAFAHDSGHSLITFPSCLIAPTSRNHIIVNFVFLFPCF